MKRIILFAMILAGSISFFASAQITEQERSQLTEGQRAIYDNQQKQITANRTANANNNFNICRNASQSAGTMGNSAGAAIICIKTAIDINKGRKQNDADQQRLDNAARKAIENNKAKAASGKK